MRLDKFLSNLNYGSRKEIKLMVKNGLVKVGNLTVKSSDVKIDPNYDKIFVNGTEVIYKENVILSFYKPAGYLSSHKAEIYPSLFELIGAPYKQYDLKIAGRLDYDSEGLVILTTSGDLVHQITHPKKKIRKVYEAKLDKHFNESSKLKLLQGVEIMGEDGMPYIGIALDLHYKEDVAYITIDEGKFHQVKKMFLEVGFLVTNLKRIQIGALTLDLEPGTYKEIEENDIFGR